MREFPPLLAGTPLNLGGDRDQRGATAMSEEKSRERDRCHYLTLGHSYVVAQDENFCAMAIHGR
jgi:hypothetical protein